jgi:hypothetical protein
MKIMTYQRLLDLNKYLRILNANLCYLSWNLYYNFVNVARIGLFFKNLPVYKFL